MRFPGGFCNKQDVVNKIRRIVNDCCDCYRDSESWQSDEPPVPGTLHRVTIASPVIAPIQNHRLCSIWFIPKLAGYLSA